LNKLLPNDITQSDSRFTGKTTHVTLGSFIFQTIYFLKIKIVTKFVVINLPI